MDKLLELLLQSEEIRFVAAITLASLMILVASMPVIAVIQGRGVSLGPLKISAKSTKQQSKKNSLTKPINKKGRLDKSESLTIIVVGETAAIELTKIIKLEREKMLEDINYKVKRIPKKQTPGSARY